MHQIPDVSNAELSMAVNETQVSDDLSLSGRSTAENRKMTNRVTHALHTVAMPICKQAGREACWFDVEFVNEDEFNAYASGNNNISIFQGIVKYIETEDELAAIVGHEMGHHISEHLEKGTQNILVGQIIGGLLYGLATANYAGYADSNSYQNGMNDAMNIGASIGGMSYSVEHEREADYIAAYLLERAGYDLEKARGIWMKMAKYSGKTKAALFDSHPIGPFRMIAWDKTVAEIASNPTLLPRLKGYDQSPEDALTGSDGNSTENPLEILNSFFSW